MRIRIIPAAVLLLLIGGMLLVPALANAPAPPSYFYLELKNPPAEAVYADLLIQLDESHADYTPFRAGSGLPEDSPIAAYREEGFVSFSLHYAKASSDPEILHGGEYQSFNFQTGGESVDRLSPQVKVALLGRGGEILRVSKAASVVPPDGEHFARWAVYDWEADTLEIRYNSVYRGYTGGFLPGSAAFLFVSAVIGRFLLSVGAETALAIPFRLRPLWKVAVVNVCSQLLMLLFLFGSGLRYNTAVALAEIAVFGGEFLVYTRLFRDLPRLRLLLYTVLANGFTLGMGLLFNALGILRG